MNNSLVKKGGKVLGSLLLCLSMSAGVSGLASAHGGSYGPPMVTVAVNSVVKAKARKVFFIVTGTHLRPLDKYQYLNSIEGKYCRVAKNGFTASTNKAGDLPLLRDVAGPSCPLGVYQITLTDHAGSMVTTLYKVVK